MSSVLLPGLIGYVLTGLAIIHALMDAKKNRFQRILILPTIFVFAAFLEVMGVITGLFSYSTEIIMILDRVPLSITLSWVGIIYSSMIISERLKLSLWLRILTTTLIALCLDWGMDPIAVESGAWTFGGGEYFNVPAVNFFGWFFIPIAYLIPYGLTWNKDIKKLKYACSAQNCACKESTALLGAVLDYLDDFEERAQNAVNQVLINHEL